MLFKKGCFTFDMSLRDSQSTKMALCTFIIAVQIIGVYSTSQIRLQNDNEHLKTATVDVVNQCFGSSERWSELLIVPNQDSHGILRKIHHQSKTSNSIVFVNAERNDNGLTYPGKCDVHFTRSFGGRRSKTTAVLITTNSVEHLETVLCCLKNNTPELWRPGSYFLVVSDTRCDAAGCNDMFKVIWDYWILNAVILCSSNEPGDRNRSEIELYGFNPYSGDHPPQWGTIINETVEVSMSSENFNHSWYIFKRRFTGIKSFDDCGDIFFDKTSNLGGYLIPISVDRSEFLSRKARTAMERWLFTEISMLKSVAKLLRFKFVEVLNNDTDKYGQRGFVNGSYNGMKKDIYTFQSQLAAVAMQAMHNPGLDIAYPHDRAGLCIVSRIVGNRPQWTNLAVAKHIWIGLGLGLLLATIFLYLQNKAHGIVSALLNAERLLIGSALINTSPDIKHRTLLGSMFLVVLVIDGAIKGRFISILTVVRPYPNIETLEQVRELDMDIYGAESYRTVIEDSWPEARYYANVSLKPCIHAIEQGERQMVCATDCRYLTYHTVDLSIVHKAVTPIWTTPIAFITAQYWPLESRYSFELVKLVESGIFEKWKLDLARDAEVNGWKQSKISETQSVKATKLNDLLPAFLLLLVGLSIALMIFASEMKRWKYLRCVEF